MATASEQRLLARCRRGEADAWDELFDRHCAATGRFVFQLAPDFTREDVEEICQDTFLSVIQNLWRFQGQSQLQTWIFRIAANKARDYRQRQHAAKRGGGRAPIPLHALDADHPAPDPASPAPGPDQRLIQAENLALIGQALEALGGPCQEILELRYFADLSYDEIARILKLNPKTVSSRLSKCLDKLEVTVRALLDREKKTSSSV